MSFQNKFRNALDNVDFSPDFQEKTLALLQQKDASPAALKRVWKVVLAAACITAFLVCSALALSALLSAQDVADRLETNVVFSDEENAAARQTVTDGQYRMTLLGQTSGQELWSINGADVQKDRSYFVVALERTDGTPLNAAEFDICLSPLVEGFAPYQVSVYTLSGSVQTCAQDGILYYLLDVDCVEVFADHTVYLAAFEKNDLFGSFENSAHIAYRADYDGFRALFTLPLDPAKADPQAVEKILNFE